MNINDTMRYGSYYGGKQIPSPSTFPEKDEGQEPIFYTAKGEPLYRAKPKFGYRSNNDNL